MRAYTVRGEVYGFDGIPFLIFFDPEGIIVERDLRGDGIYQCVKTALEAYGLK